MVIVATVGLTGCGTTSTKEDDLSAVAVTVIRSRGNALYSHDGTNWLAIKKGQEVICGDIIKTSERSLVDLLIGREYNPPASAYNPTMIYVPASDFENRVRILPGSELILEKLSRKRVGSWFDGKTDTFEIGMRLRSGSMVGNARRRPVVSLHEINLGSRAIEIEGGLYGVISNDLVMVLSGQARILNGNKDPVLVVARHQFNFATGTIAETPPSYIIDDSYPRMVPLDSSPQPLPSVTPIYREPMTPPVKPR